MLSRRIPGGFVCLRCRLSLASRSRTRPSPLRTPSTALANVALRYAPSRNYSESAEKPVWTGRLPIEVDEPHEDPDLWRELDKQALDPGRSSEPPEDARSIADRHPRETDAGGLEDAGHKGVWSGSVRYETVEETRDARQSKDEDGEPSAYRQIRVHDNGKARKRQPSHITLHVGPEFYSAKGQRLKPTNRELPIDILGRPGHALVMRDAGKKPRRQLEQMPEDEPADSESAMNLVKIYESTQVDVPSAAEVLHNIHELKPSETVLTQREFEALKKTLYKGFTKTQLATYIHKASLVEKDQDGTQLDLRPWVLEKWPWAPELKSEFETTDALLQGYVKKSTSPKERLVVSLMRQCWGLGIREIQSQQGYLDVRVQDLQFDLLMLGNRRWLESISKSLFELGTQIELIRSQKIVRIVGPKATAELILQEINTLLEKTHTRSMPAAEISPKPLDQSVLDFVGQFTHTVIRYDKTSKDIEVSWIPSSETKREGLEDVGGVTFRLLYSAYGYKQPGDATTEVQPKPNEVGGWYLQDYHSKPKMAWKDRLGKWARWTIATPRRGVKAADPVDTLTDDPLLRSLDMSTSVTFAPDGWSSEPQIRSKAIFGHVLHREPKELDVEDAFSREIMKDKERVKQEAPPVGHPHHNRNNRIHDRLDWRLERTITPIIPPLKSLAALTSTGKSNTTQISILMHFIPAPGNPTSPSLELTLLMDPDTDRITPHSLRAVSRVTTHDILLPSRPVDIRLSETTSHILPGSAIPDSCPEIMTFLSSSDLRPSEGVLSTPARPPPLRLPPRILSSSAPPTQPSSTPFTTSPETDPQATTTSYIFAGLELHRKVSTSLSGWKLGYTSIEAGQGGGRRAELALEGLRTDDNEVDENGLPLSDFERFERGYLSPSTRLNAAEDAAPGEARLEAAEKSGVEEKPEVEEKAEAAEGGKILEAVDGGQMSEAGEEKKKTRVQGFVETLSRLALGREFTWYGEMPERVGRDAEGLDSTGDGRTGREEV
ncbi:mitochondrial inner-membrane-bound regulator-domain-containing protein [Coniochaeta sp. 2T2.1]|nr:mitochondrial inner-membrane-bound regulator-domain-containing protein [Coniochaeta sp. 2T2.1]